MTTRPQHDPHLDADQLNAFAEGALSAPERALCLQHLAECAHCREIAFLAGAALPPEEPAPTPARRFHFGWWPVLSLGAVSLAAIIIAVVLLQHRRPNIPSAPVQVATDSATSSPPPPMTETRPSQSAPAQPQAQAVSKPSPSERAARKPESPILDNRQVNDAAALDSTAASAQPGAGAAQQQAAASGMALKAPGTMAPLAQPSPAQAGAVAKTTPSVTLRSFSAGPASSNNFAQITGTITDSSGATIPRAKITLDLTAGTSHREAFTDNSGQFTLGSLPPGKYRLEISSPGFQSQVREVELGISQVARADSRLATGSASETVSVEGAASALNTESASLQSQLPDQATPQTTVNSGSRSLTLDTSGRLFLSKNKHWKTVHGPWKKSAVTGLALTPDQSFKVTTAGGSWLSADGQHWHPAN